MTFTDYLNEGLDRLSEKGTFGLEDIKEVTRIVARKRMIMFWLYKMPELLIIVFWKILGDKKLKNIVVEAIENDILAGDFDPETVRKGFSYSNIKIEKVITRYKNGFCKRLFNRGRDWKI